ncbi:uncharacterized protein LOC120334421 isoform X3 [Styela clava]
MGNRNTFRLVKLTEHAKGYGKILKEHAYQVTPDVFSVADRDIVDASNYGIAFLSRPVLCRSFENFKK